MSWRCFFSHDWEIIFDEDTKKVDDIFWPSPAPLNRVCLRCKKVEKNASLYLIKRQVRKQRRDEILEEK